MASGGWNSNAPRGADGGDVEGKLYVTGLPGDIDQEELRKVFAVYGPVEDVHLVSRQEGRSDRAGLVKFEDPKDATAAMLVLSDIYKFRSDGHAAISISLAKPRRHDYGSKGGQKGGDYNNGYQNHNWGNSGNNTHHQDQQRQSFQAPPAPAAGQSSSGARDWNQNAQQGSKLWVGNLPPDITNDMLQKLFSQHGQVAEVNILPAKSKSGQLCAFVNFHTSEEVDRCLQHMGRGFEYRPGDGELKVERPGARSGGKGGGRPRPY